MKSSKILLLCSSFLYTSTANAEDSSSRFIIKGFGTLSGTRTDNDAIGFRRDISQWTGVHDNWDITKDSRFGVQIDAKLTETIKATVQWVAKDHVGDFLEQNLEWAFLNWNITSDLNLRAGRLGADAFMISDCRNIGYSYPWIRPPHEYYANIPYYHFDGIDVTKKFDVGGGLLSMKAFAGYSFNQMPVQNILLEQTSFNMGAHIQFEKEDWRFKASYAHMELMSEIPFDKYANSDLPLNQFVYPANVNLLNAVWPGVKEILPNISVINKVVNYASIGGAYDDGIWLAQAEVSYINTDTTWYPDQAAGYLSVGRRFSSVTVYSLLGIVESLDPDISIPKPPSGISKLEQAYSRLDSSINGNNFGEKSISLGLRWDFYTNMAFKAQWSHYWLGKERSRAWVYNSSDMYPNQNQINVFSVGVDFVF